MTSRNYQKVSAEKTVRDIRRATRKRYAAEEKIRIVLEGLRGEDSIAEGTDKLTKSAAESGNFMRLSTSKHIPSGRLHRHTGH